MVKVYCDGCGKHLKGADLNWSNAFMGEVKRQDNIFCEVCAPHAGGYWDEKDELVTRIQTEAASRVDNHLKSFYAKTRKKLIEVVK